MFTGGLHRPRAREATRFCRGTWQQPNGAGPHPVMSIRNGMSAHVGDLPAPAALGPPRGVYGMAVTSPLTAVRSAGQTHPPGGDRAGQGLIEVKVGGVSMSRSKRP